MITKDVRDIFGLMEMFQNRTVVMAAQVRKLSPRARVQPVKTSLSGRRLTAGRLNEQWVLGPDAQLGPPPTWGSYWDLLSLHRDWQQPQGITGHGGSGPRAFPLVLITACHQTCMQCTFLFFCLF